MGSVCPLYGISSMINSTYTIYRSSYAFLFLVSSPKEKVRTSPETEIDEQADESLTARFNYPSSKLVTPNHLSRGKVGSCLLYILVVRKTSVMPQL
jgi:hypothetical protein